MNIQHQPIAKSQQKIRTYPELRQQIHDDLRIQHPEWIEANGESPMCDFYEARLMEELYVSALDRDRRTILSQTRIATESVWLCGRMKTGCVYGTRIGYSRALAVRILL